MPETDELPPVYPNAETFIEQSRKGSHAEPVSDMLVREPAHEAMKVPCQPLIALGNKAMFATLTAVGDSPELYDLPSDRSGLDNEIKCAFAPVLQTLRPLVRV